MIFIFKHKKEQRTLFAFNIFFLKLYILGGLAPLLASLANPHFLGKVYFLSGITFLGGLIFFLYGVIFLGGFTFPAGVIFLGGVIFFSRSHFLGGVTFPGGIIFLGGWAAVAVETFESIIELINDLNYILGSSNQIRSIYIGEGN